MSKKEIKCPNCNSDNMTIIILPDGSEFHYCLDCQCAYQNMDTGFWHLSGYDKLLVSA